MGLWKKFRASKFIADYWQHDQANSSESLWLGQLQEVQGIHQGSAALCLPLPNTICAGQEHAGLVRSTTSLPVTENSNKESAAQRTGNFHFIQSWCMIFPFVLLMANIILCADVWASKGVRKDIDSRIFLWVEILPNFEQCKTIHILKHRKESSLHLLKMSFSNLYEHLPK